jgi:invasion protein IalB
MDDAPLHSDGSPGRPDSAPNPAFCGLTAMATLDRLPARCTHSTYGGSQADSPPRQLISGGSAFKAPSLPCQTCRTDMAKGPTPMGLLKHLQRTTAGRPAPGRAAWRCLAGGLAIAGVLLASPGAQAQGAVRSVHGDWQIRCDTPPGAQSEQCALIQSVVAEDRSNAGLTVIVLKTADQKSKLMRVVAPLGVLLPSGLGLKLDNVDVGRAGFVRCLPNGCVAEVVMDDKLLGQLRTAKTATFIIFETPEEGIGFPLSLNGIGEGYDKLP